MLYNHAAEMAGSRNGTNQPIDSLLHLCIDIASEGSSLWKAVANAELPYARLCEEKKI